MLNWIILVIGSHHSSILYYFQKKDDSVPSTLTAFLVFCTHVLNIFINFLRILNSSIHFHSVFSMYGVIRLLKINKQIMHNLVILPCFLIYYFQCKYVVNYRSSISESILIVTSNFPIYGLILPKIIFAKILEVAFPNALTL